MNAGMMFSGMVVLLKLLFVNNLFCGWWLITVQTNIAQRLMKFSFHCSLLQADTTLIRMEGNDVSEGSRFSTLCGSVHHFLKECLSPAPFLTSMILCWEMT